jgi:alpha-tubulin suppressor-like RCC1 family protein
VAIATTSYEIAGLKSDGSLWSALRFEQVAAKGRVAPFHAGSPQPKGSTVRPAELNFERVGDESAWATVAASSHHCVALKRDGTIWGWGNNENKQLGDGPKLITNTPVQIGQAASWTAIYAGEGHSYAVNRDGEIWKWGKSETGSDPVHHKIEEGPVRLNIKVPGVRSIVAGKNDCDLFLDTDGNLWGLGHLPAALSGEGYGAKYFSEPRRLGGTNWLSVSYSWQALTGLKTDGTLWTQRGHDLYNWPLPTLAQLGKRTDWIAVWSDWEADLALAKDGTICRFGDQTSGSRMELLAPTRRVTWSLNLLDAAK